MSSSWVGKIGALVLTYNRKEVVSRCLTAIMAQAEPVDEVIVLDNGSTDGTAGVVSERFPDVEIISTGKNIGAAARAFGVERAAAPYVALCDDDTWWESGSLRRAADLFDALPRLAVVTARVLVGPENREDGICEVLARSPLPRQPALQCRSSILAIFMVFPLPTSTA